MPISWRDRESFPFNKVPPTIPRLVLRPRRRSPPRLPAQAHRWRPLHRGSRPPHHVDASGSVDRKVMQKLDVLEKIDDEEEGASRGGRRATQSGVRDLDRIAQTAIEEDEEEDDD